MKKNFFALLMVVMMVLTLTGCSTANNRVTDNGYTNPSSFENYDFWEKENELRIDTSFTLHNSISSEDNFENIPGKKLPAKYEKTVKKLKNGIIKFFAENYSIDVSEKLNKQIVKVFKTDININSTTMGYVDSNNPNILNLNELILTEEYSYLFNNTYVHESLHQLGIKNVEEKMLMEGITDAFTDLILCYLGEKSFPTPNYYEARQLAYQIIKVDKEFPKLYFENENFSLSKRITEKLKDVKRTNLECKTPGKNLIGLLSILYSNNLGVLQCNTDPYWYAHDAQAIVYAYCKECNPDQKSIDYIRAHYLVADFENEYEVNYH